MGWLRDLMAETAPPVRSYGRLARAALAHPSWPEEGRPQPRSLASLFSKLDREQELDWLADRPYAQHILAELLGTSLANVERTLSDSVADLDERRRHLRLDDVPFARVLDLGVEPLPPGIPDLVLQPPRWERLLWRAPSGAGRSLAGRWLAARGLAGHLDVLSARDARASIAQSGPVFVEFHSAAAARAFLEAGPRAPVCVAAPLEADASLLERAGFAEITSPSPSAIVEPLVAWLEPRLPPDGQFDGESATRFLVAAIRAGNVTTLGDLIGLLGLADELGVRELARRGPEELARRYVSRRMRATRKPEEEGTSWQSESYDLLLAMCRRAMTDSSLAWDAPRSLSGWAQLVPPEHQRAIDPEWLKLTISQTATASTLKEVDRALRQLPPGGYRIVSTFKTAGLMRASASGDAYVAAPQWLSSWIGKAARRSLVDGSPFEWGEALLEPTVAGQIYEELVRRVEKDADAVVEDVLELEASASPAYAIAVESVARAVGTALLCEAIEPPESIAALWDAAIALLVNVDGTPHPRVPMPPSLRPELDLGAYHLAMLALSEALPVSEGRRHLQLRPWLVPRPGQELTRVLEAIFAAAASWQGAAELVSAAFKLVARLVPLRQKAPDFEPHPMEHPALMIAAIAEGRLDWDAARGAFSPPWMARGLGAIAEQAEVSWARVGRAFFEAWGRAGYPDAPLVASASGAAPDLWHHAPASTVLRLLEQAHLDEHRLPWGALSRDTWRAVLEARPGAMKTKAAWQGREETEVELLLAQKLPEAAGAGFVWEHWPSRALAAVGHHLGRMTDVAAFIDAAPPERNEELLRIVAPWARAAPDAAIVRPWLHRIVGRRAPDWRSAYALLSEVERAAERA